MNLFLTLCSIVLYETLAQTTLPPVSPPDEHPYRPPFPHPDAPRFPHPDDPKFPPQFPDGPFSPLFPDGPVQRQFPGGPFPPNFRGGPFPPNFPGGQFPPRFPGGQFRPPFPDRPVSPCGQKWDCKNNCTTEKKALDLCCSSNHTRRPPRGQPSGQPRPCSQKCLSFEFTHNTCLKICKPKPKSCPTDLSLSEDFCNKACKHGRKGNGPCGITMYSVSPLCKPDCQYDRNCLGEEKCCPTACSTSCIKPV